MKATGDWLANAARVLALALVVALPFMGGYMFDSYLLGAALWALVCALAAALACAFGSGGVRRGLGRAAWPLAGFMAWLVIATFTSVYLHASLMSLLHIGSYIALMAVFASLFSDERWRRWAWIAIAAAGAVEGIIGLRDWTQTVIFQGDPSWRIFGTMFNPNVLAGYFLVVLAAVAVTFTMAWRSTQEGPDRPRLALIGAGFALLIAGAALLLTGSRAGLLGAMFGTAVFFVAAPTRIRARWLVVAGIVLVALVLIAPPLRNRLVSAATQSHSTVFRWYTWVGTVEMIEARPLLGFGPGTWEYAHPQFAHVGFTRMAHETPLQVAAEAGLPALLLVAGAVALIARRLVLGLRAGGLTAVECAAGLAALAAVGLHNLADYTWYLPAVGQTLAAAVGLALAASRVEPPVPAPRWPCWVGASIVLVATVAAGWGLRAQVLHRQGEVMLAQGGYQTATIPLRRAAELDPLDAQIAQDLARSIAVSPLGGPARAVEIRLKAAKLNPLDGGNYVALAELYEALGERQSAINAAKRAVEVQPNQARPYVVLAQLQERAGRDAEALQTWRALEDVWEGPVGRYQPIEQPTGYDWAYAWMALGREAERQGNGEQAAKYYRRAQKLAGGFAETRRKREKLLREIGQFNEAEVREAERIAREAERGLERVEEPNEEGDGE